MSKRPMAWHLSAVIAVAAALTVSTSALSAAGDSVRPGTADGTVAYWAEQPGNPPNWIFPMANLAYYSQANVEDFQYLMYRPLYWFGSGSAPTLDRSLSLAYYPKFSDGDTVVTIKLKSWMWSNGTKVDARSVLFFMNMVRAEKYEWAGYATGEFPDNVASVSAPSLTSNTVTFQLTRAVNTAWFVDNELSQITPLPTAWDIDKTIDGQPATPGSGGCSRNNFTAATELACQKVWSFLTDDNGTSSSPKEAADLSTYATNPLWQDVDGPWHLTGFDALSGEVTMAPNPRYSGPVKPSISEFVEVPFTSDTAEYNALQSGAVDVGYLPLADAPAATTPGVPGPNPLSGQYSLSEQPSWQVNYFVDNFNSTGDRGEAGYIIDQLYFRRAFQSLIDSASIMATAYKNYAVATDGPVPLDPASSFLSSGETHNAYGYDVSAAISILEANGWDVVAGGTDTCADPGTGPGECGLGITKGAKLSFTEITASGSSSLISATDIEAKDLAKAGIQLSTTFEPFDEVLGSAAPCTRASHVCTWEFANWGGGWLYMPDYEPTGDEQFATGAGSNVGNYTSAKDDALIADTLYSNSKGAFHRWENYLSSHMPVVWQPTATTPVEVSVALSGVVDSPFDNLNPENWSFNP